MKRLENEEIFQNLSGFLKGKGIELTAGGYAQAIQKSCSVLTDVINMSQEGVTKTKTKLDQKLDQLRQVVHEKTAPKPASPAPPPVQTEPVKPEPAATATAPKPESPAARKLPRKKAAPQKRQSPKRPSRK